MPLVWQPPATLAAASIAAAAIVFGAGAVFGILVAEPSFAAIADSLQEALFTLLLFGGLLAVAIVGLRLARIGIGSLIGPAPGRMAGIGCIVGAGGLAAAAALAALALHIEVSPAAPPPGVVALVGGTLLVLFQAGTEEVYFRGWLQAVLVRSWGPIPGLLAAATAFAVLHLISSDRSVLTVVNLLLAGLLFGVLALRSGGIALPIFAHFAWNWAEGIALGLAPNPGVGSFGALVDLDMTGAAAWGGAAEGLNASLATGFVLTALIIPFAVWRGLGSRPVSSPARPG